MIEQKRPYFILIATGEQGHMSALLTIAAPLARARSGKVVPLYVTTQQTPPAWLHVPAELRDIVAEPCVVQGTNVGRAILRCARELEPDLLLLYWKGQVSRGRYLLGPTLDPVIQHAPCDVAVVRVGNDPELFARRISGMRRILVPSGGGPNALLALGLGLDMGPGVTVCALRVAKKALGPTAISAQWEMLRNALAPWEDEPRLDRRVSLSTGIADGILEEAEKGYDLVLVGATRESFVDRLLFGNLPQELANTVRQPLIIVRRHDPAPAAAIRRARWRLLGIMPQLALPERIEIYRKVRRDARTSTDFYVMMVLSAGIASLGLLLNSPAVIIGAMLVAPMMATLVGIGLGIVQGDSSLLRLAVRTLIVGVLLAVGMSAVIGAAVPFSGISQEMLARGSPTLLDLAVALISGAAAAYAIARKNLASALPGVAIAVALVPPLASIGLGAVSGNGQIALGAALLFATNLVAIVAAVAIVFLWMGFHPNIREEIRGRTFRGGLLSTAVLLATITVVLALVTLSSVRQASQSPVVRRVLEHQTDQMGVQVTLEDWQILGEQSDRLLVSIALATSRQITEEEIELLDRHLEAHLGRPVLVSVTLTQVTRMSTALD